jgi:hypothetical protein
MTTERSWGYLRLFFEKQTHPHFILSFDPKTRTLRTGKRKEMLVSGLIFGHALTQAWSKIPCYSQILMSENSLDETRKVLAIISFLLFNTIAVLSAVCMWTVGLNNNNYPYCVNGARRFEIGIRGLFASFRCY